MTISFVIPGAPRTKKNHGRVVQRGKRKYHVQSKAFEAWNEAAQLWLAKWKSERRPDLSPFALPIAKDVNCRVLIFRDAYRGDAVGYYQGLADALQEAGIVENDAQIVSWDGSRMLVSQSSPRLEVELTTI